MWDLQIIHNLLKIANWVRRSDLIETDYQFELKMQFKMENIAYLISENSCFHA